MLDRRRASKALIWRSEKISREFIGQELRNFREYKLIVKPRKFNNEIRFKIWAANRRLGKLVKIIKRKYKISDKLDSFFRGRF